MPDPARKNLSVLTFVHDKIRERYKAEKTDLSFVKWVSEYLLMNLEKDEFVKQYAPYLKKVDDTENRITIRDNKKNNYTDVYLKDKQLYCELDESTDCVHIHFVLALPELGRLKTKNK